MMKIEENLDLFNKLKNEFKKKYGTKEVKLPNPIMLDNDSMCGPSYLEKLRINPDTNEFEWYKEYWDYGWRQEREEVEFSRTFANVWFEALCQVLDCKQQTTYYLPSGKKIYSTGIKDCNGK